MRVFRNLAALVAGVLLFAAPALAESGSNAFTPGPANTVNLSCATSSSNVQLNGVGGSIEIYNSGSVTCFLNWGTTNAVTAATSTGYPVPPGVDKIISLPGETRWIAGITASGTATVYLSSGEGI